MEDKLPMKPEQPAEQERTWRDVAQRWKEVGQQLKDLGERLGSAFREGWATDAVTEEESRKVAARLRELGERLDRAVDAMRGEAKQPDTKAKAKETMKATREASTVLLGELQETLADGLAEINKRVDELVKKRKEGKGS
jgi:hypothetical protein